VADRCYYYLWDAARAWSRFDRYLHECFEHKDKTACENVKLLRAELDAKYRRLVDECGMPG
jgi:hypothetical protein